jgi:hypothetical protein
MRCSKNECSPLVLVVFAVSLLALSPLAFHSKLPLLFYRFDGTYLLYVATMQKVWSIGGWNIGSNPLQGIGGMDVPWRASLDPGLWLVAQLPASIAQIVAMTFYAAELAIAIVWLAIRLGLAPLTTVAAAWIGLLLAFPYVYPSLGFDFLWGGPTMSHSFSKTLRSSFFFSTSAAGRELPMWPDLSLSRASALIR